MHVRFLVQEVLRALTHRARLHEIQCRKYLVTGVGAVQVKRTLKSQIDWRIHEVDTVVIVIQHVQNLTEKHRAFRQPAESLQHI